MSTAYTQKENPKSTNTGKHVTSRDEMYIVVDRSQTTPGLWGQMTLSRVKWGGADPRPHRVGWIVKRSQELGIRYVMNYMMVNLVKGNTQTIDLEIGGGVPFVSAEVGKKDGGLQAPRGVAGPNTEEDNNSREDQSGEKNRSQKSKL